MSNKLQQDKQSEKPDYDFNYSEWIAIYPEFSGVNPIQANNYAASCVSFFNPTKVKSVVCDPRERKNLFYLLVAHYAFLMTSNDGGSQIGGIINSVTEGSVSLGSDTSGLAKMNSWLVQSKYGQMFEQFTKKYRSTFYIRPIPDPRLRIVF